MVYFYHTAGLERGSIVQTYIHRSYLLEYIYDPHGDAFHAHVKVEAEHHTLTAKSVNRLRKLFEEKVDASLTNLAVL